MVRKMTREQEQRILDHPEISPLQYASFVGRAADRDVARLREHEDRVLFELDHLDELF